MQIRSLTCKKVFGREFSLATIEIHELISFIAFR